MAAEEPAKYRRIAGDLRDAIRGGKYEPGSRLPSKSALMDAYGVAVGTVDDALNLLRSEGLLYSEHGRGTFVADPLPAQARSEYEAISARLDALEEAVRQLRGEVSAVKRGTAEG
jgi:DNA-binding GntR family transcriptional regulator